MIGEHSHPIINEDGTFTAVVAAPPRMVDGNLWLALALPSRMDAEHAAGRFVLARCGAQSELERAEQWSIYLRRPLFVVARPQHGINRDLAAWQFCAPCAVGDAGYEFLAQRQQGEQINLTGFCGNGFPLSPLVRRLLLLADPARLGLLAPLIDDALDRGGQVSLLLLEEQPAQVDMAALRDSLPLSVELHTLDSSGWAGGVASSLRWADQACAALPAHRLPQLAEAIRQARLRLESGFAFALVEADLACGYGACLACVVLLANGSLTRACIHGPVFDLLELAGKG